MEDNMTYYERLFTRSEEEERIDAELDAERKRFEETEEYKEHTRKTRELLDDLIEAGKRRRKEAEQYKPSRRRGKLKRVDPEVWKAEQKKIYEERFAGYPKELQDAINAFNALDENEKKAFCNDTWCWHPDYDDYENPQTTENDLKELLEILVQTTIDFINERGLKDIDAIGFSADSLQESAKWGEWVSATDASVHATGLGKEKGRNGEEYTVVKRIGEYM